MAWNDGEGTQKIDDRSYWMGPAEWLGAASLFVALVALIVAGIAAASQLASLKRPLPSVDLLAIQHIDDGIGAHAGTTEQMFVAGLVIRVTNRGHEPMLHPKIYDWTEGLVLTSVSRVQHLMPSVLGAGESVELVTNYSLANYNDRVIGIVWEEASLFRREPVTMGVRYRLPIAYPGWWGAKPTERWKRTGLGMVKGWKNVESTGLLGKKQRPTMAALSNGASWVSTQEQAGMDIYKRLSVVLGVVDGVEQIQGRPELSPAEIARMRKLGRSLPA